MKINIHYISGISGDRIEVTSEDRTIRKVYTFGYDCAYKRNNATKKMPYIGELLTDFVESNNINAEDITYSGYNVFQGKTLTKDEVEVYFNNIFSEL